MTFSQFSQFHDLDTYLKYKANKLQAEGLHLSILIYSLNKFDDYPIDSAYRHIFENVKINPKDFNKIIAPLYADLTIDTFQNCFDYVNETIEKSKITKRECLVSLMLCCWKLSDLYIYEKNIQDRDKEIFSFLEDVLRSKSCEAIGYWTAKLEHKKRSKNQETKQQQEAIKEKFVTETWLKLINNPAEKKALESLSQNKIAKRIQEKAITDLKNVKTATGKFVLTRTKKIDKEGKTILSGLSIDTIIAIMRRQDKFTFNPFKK